MTAGAAPPEASPRLARVARRFVTPIESFLHVEASSGIVLLVAAALALVAANSSFAGTYHHLLELPIGFRLGGLVVELPLHFWINDGLMTIFFFVVGLEIRREAHEGELSSLRRAALPAAAALGGMVTPALIYLAVAGGNAGDRVGWGVPMATDIAFAVGVLALLGKRVPPALRVLLLALAIIDDIGSIVVIAIFYSGALDPSGFLIAGIGVGGILVMKRIGIRRAAFYVVPGFVVWLGLLRSGVHPTIGGVIVGLLTPARAWFGAEGLAHAAREGADRLEGHVDTQRVADEASLLDQARREALAPAARLQLLLHPWVAFGIMPIFAFANAGVRLDGNAVSLSRVAIGIVVGLVVGKPIGIVAASMLAVRLRIATLPRAIGVRELVVVGIVAGIGFTMAIFVAALAFGDATKLDGAKAAILAASTIAIALSLLAGRLLCKVRAAPAASAHEAERSDEE